MMRARHAIRFALAAIPLLTIGSARTVAADPAKLELRQGDRIILIGNTLAERMQYFGNFETAASEPVPGTSTLSSTTSAGRPTS